MADARLAAVFDDDDDDDDDDVADDPPIMSKSRRIGAAILSITIRRTGNLRVLLLFEAAV
jgi:hypothetical protein